MAENYESEVKAKGLSFRLACLLATFPTLLSFFFSLKALKPGQKVLD